MTLFSPLWPWEKQGLVGSFTESVGQSCFGFWPDAELETSSGESLPRTALQVREELSAPSDWVEPNFFAPPMSLLTALDSPKVSIVW